MTPDKEQRLQELRKLAEQRAEREKEDAAERELLALELRARYEAEGLKEGVDFLVQATNVGVLAVKLSTVLALQTFQNSPGAKPTEAQMYALVKPCVLYPAGDEFDRLKDKHGALLSIATAMVVALHGVRTAQERGE